MAVDALVILLVAAAAPLPSPSSLAARAARFPPVRAVVADFAQEREVSLVDEVLRAGGTIMLKAPAAMRLELTQPEPLVLVANGAKVTVLDAEGTPLPLPPEMSGIARFARELTELLLGGKTNERFDEHWEGADFVRLGARDERSPFAEITLRFPAAGPLPDEIVLRERSGDRTTIRLSAVQLNPALDDTRFRIDAAGRGDAPTQ
jgi:outer membrane lipoprotein-sorting protein